MIRVNRQSQKGAAAVLITLVLAAVLVLATLLSHRGLLLEARMSANQMHSTVAFEAAEAGIEWAIAQLNQPRTIDANCRIGPSASSSFRDRFVALSTAAEGFAGRTWLSTGVPMPLQAACVRGGGAWNCHCPVDGPVSLAEPEGTALAPMFSVQFEAGGQAGVLRIVATGCSRLSAPCLAGSGVRSEGTARVQVSLALLPALASAPAAPLTTIGNIRTGAAIGLANQDPRSGGIVAHAGGAIDTALARLTVPAGSSSADALIGRDTSLSGIGPDALFVSLFGLPKASWQTQAVVQRITCQGTCAGTELAQLIAQNAGPAQLWIDGDVLLEGPLTLGSAQRPVVIVASGAVQLRGAVSLHGVLYAHSLAWDQASAPDAVVRGALISETDYGGDAAPDLIRDAAVLALLRNQAGNLARVPGSWRDF
jgi:hypothetical protein